MITVGWESTLKRQKKTGENLKVSLLLFVLLVFTVAAYNYQFYDVPRSMYLNAYNLCPERVTYLHVTLPSKGIPNLGFMDVTNDTDFNLSVLDYIAASDIISSPIKVDRSSAEWWLKNISKFSEYDITLKYYNDTYFLQVRFLPDIERTITERFLIWTIDIMTVIAGLYFIVIETPILKKWIKWRKRNEEVSITICFNPDNSVVFSDQNCLRYFNRL
ncbi:MAG: hypothetical protein QW270_08440 [Candidatus Bathyarchaeia archaeon]